MANQVPRRRQPFCSSALPFPLLDAVFAKVPHTRFKSLAYRVRRMRLGYANQSNLISISPRSRRSAGDSLLHSKQIFPH